MKEEWKRVERYPNYKVSNTGKIFSIASNRELKLGAGTNGYSYFTSYPEKRIAYIHTCVAENFIGKRPNGFQIDHIDRNKTNNHPSNLRYVTPRVNNHNIRTQSKYGAGVSAHRKRFQSRIRFKGKRYFLGSYICPVIAGSKYWDAVKRIEKGCMA